MAGEFGQPDHDRDWRPARREPIHLEDPARRFSGDGTCGMLELPVTLSSSDQHGSMKASELKTKPIVSMADGVQIRRAALRVAALPLTTTGGRSVLPFVAVRSLGADAVTMERATATRAGRTNQAQATSRGIWSDLIGRKVVDGEGAYLGDVRTSPSTRLAAR